MTTAVILLTLIMLGGTAYSETELNISGQVRLRQELSSKDFDATVKMLEFRDLRTRLGVEAIIDGNTHAFVQLQDSRRIGGDDQFDERQSGTLNDGKNVDMHQAYIQVDRLFADNVGAKFGRFELNLGSQRVFGAVGWHNVGRSWEGCQFWYDVEAVKLTGLRLKAREDNYIGGNTDLDIYGLYTTVKKLNFDLFAVYEFDATEVILPTDPATQASMLKRFNVGTYYHRVSGPFDFDLNFVYQFGTQINAGRTLEEDIAALMFTFETGYTFSGNKKFRLAAGVDYSSGDDDLTDNKYKAYNNLYYTGHKYRGYMDYFLGSGDTGLMDAIFRIKFDPAPKWTVKCDFHYFKTAQDYTVDTVSTSDVGMEFDLTVKTGVVDGLGITCGGSVFLAEETWAGVVDPDPAYWLYSMLTANF